MFEAKKSKKAFAIVVVCIFLWSCVQISASNRLVSASASINSNGISVADNQDGSYNITYQPATFTGPDAQKNLFFNYTINPIGDKYIKLTPFQAYNSGDLKVGFTADWSIHTQYASLLRFDLTGFPYKASNVELRLYDLAHNLYPGVYVYNIAQPWGKVSYDKLVEDSINSFSYSYVNSKGWTFWNITNLYNDWKAGRTMNNGLLLQASSPLIEFVSASDSSFRPELVITYRPTICIDPGHGGHAEWVAGAHAADGTREGDLNLNVSYDLLGIFANFGRSAPNVYLTRYGDYELANSFGTDKQNLAADLQARCDLANENATIFVSIHHNGGGGHGSEVVFQPTYLSSKLADITYGELESWLALSSSRSDPVNFDTDYVLLKTKMPAIISEAAYMDNTRDYSFIESPLHQMLEAEAIYESITQYLSWYNLGGGIQKAHSQTMAISGHCPIDLEITDSQGRVFSKTLNEIPDAIYDEGSNNDTVYLPDADGYQIRVVPETGALPNDTFTLDVTKNGVTTVLAENVTIADIPSAPYSFGSVVTLGNQVNFAQSGSGVNPIVNYSIDNGATLWGTAPFSVPIQSGQTITYTYQSIVSGNLGVQYALTGTTPISPQTITSDTNISGNYKTQYQVNFTANSPSMGTINPSGTSFYDSGSSVQVLAIPNSGYHIASITINGTAVGTAVPYAVQNIQGATTVLATFAADPTTTPSPTPSATPHPTTAPTIRPTTDPTAPAPTAKDSPSPSPAPTVPEFPLLFLALVAFSLTLISVAMVTQRKHGRLMVN